MFFNASLRRWSRGALRPDSGILWSARNLGKVAPTFTLAGLARTYVERTEEIDALKEAQGLLESAFDEVEAKDGKDEKAVGAERQRSANPAPFPHLFSRMRVSDVFGTRPSSCISNALRPTVGPPKTVS